VLIALGVILGCALYFHTLSLVGRSIRRVGSDGLGSADGVVPISLVVAGMALAAKRIRHGVLASAGFLAIVIFASAGLAELFGGTPKLSASLTVLGDAGGFIGALVGRPTDALVGAVAATVLLLVVAFIGAVMLCGIPLQVAFGSIGRNAKALGHLTLALAKHVSVEDDEAEEERVGSALALANSARLAVPEDDDDDDTVPAMVEAEPEPRFVASPAAVAAAAERLPACRNS